MNPPEKEFPIRMFNRSANKNDNPSKNAWITYNQGATNKKVYSIGSVIPVKNEVKPPLRYKPPSFWRFLFGKQRYIA